MPGFPCNGREPTNVHAAYLSHKRLDVGRVLLQLGSNLSSALCLLCLARETLYWGSPFLGASVIGFNPDGADSLCAA